MNTPATPSNPAADHLPKPEGILVLDKPAGVSSAGLLNRLKRALPRKTKLGHAGTLDPFATGVLLALVGKATKRCEELMGAPKVYVATVKLGATTETLDPESVEQLIPPTEIPTEERVREVLAGYAGEVMQVPPAYSAMKVGGKRAYDLARAGNLVELPARPVKVYRMTMCRYQWPELELEMEVGRGFYVRSLARDIGAALGTAGYLTALRRTRVGAFGVEQSGVGPFAAEGDGVAGSGAVRVEEITPENLCSLLRR